MGYKHYVCREGSKLIIKKGKFTIGKSNVLYTEMRKRVGQRHLTATE